MKNRFPLITFYNLIGVVLILFGLFMPSAILINWLRPLNGMSPPLQEQLMLGTLLFKVGLVILGGLVIILRRLNIWTTGDRVVTTSFNLDPNQNRNLMILAMILLAALALRLYRLEAGLWHDEIATYVSYVRIPFGESISIYDSENQHLLYTLFAQLSSIIFGDSAWALRFPAVLFGVGSIGALYLLGREVGSSKEALLSSALLTFSYHHIWFSQNARGYTGLLFWTLLASWLLLRALREDRALLWFFYSLAIAFGIYTQMTMIFVVISHFLIYLVALFRRRKETWNRWSGFFLGFCLGGFFTLFIHALVLPQILVNVVEESTVAAWKRPLWTLLEFVNGMEVGFASQFVAVPALLIFGLGLWNFARTKPELILLLFVPTFIGAVVVIGTGHHLWPRFFFFTMGFGTLIVMRGNIQMGQLVAKIINLSPSKGALIGTLLCVGLIVASAISIPFVYGPKQDYQSALTFVEQNKQPGDAVAVVGLAEFTYKSYYKTEWEVVETLAALNDIRSQSERTWLLYTFPPEVQAVYPEIMGSIETEFDIVTRFPGTVRNGTVFVSRSDLEPAE